MATTTILTADTVRTSGLLGGPASLVGDWISLAGGNGVTATFGIHASSNGGTYWNVPTNKDHRWRINGSDVVVLNATSLAVTGAISTTDPAGGAGPSWKLGVAASVSPASPNRTLRVDIAGTSYYIHAKTTND